MNKAWQILIRVSRRLAMLNCFKFAPWGRIGNYTDLLQTGANVMNKLFPGSWNNTLWWIKRSHVFLVNPSNLIISAQRWWSFEWGHRSGFRWSKISSPWRWPLQWTTRTTCRPTTSSTRWRRRPRRTLTFPSSNFRTTVSWKMSEAGCSSEKSFN